MVHHTTPAKSFATIAATKTHTIKQTKTIKKDSTCKFIKPTMFGDITYYEVGVNSWNQPEEAYMYNT
ncbi:serine/threonine-protein phosphatase [Acrasis kona]|uniref:Serine/threonine-protein phosphatase n=1 Tax=Acrasis kona TaxID=1008807 RepID=A0AAW2ZRI7_9EUKA